MKYKFILFSPWLLKSPDKPYPCSDARRAQGGASCQSRTHAQRLRQAAASPCTVPSWLPDDALSRDLMQKTSCCTLLLELACETAL